MKKSVLTTMLLLLAFFPTFSQEALTEEVPVETLTLKKGNLPPAVLNAGEEMYKGSTQVQWGLFPSELKDYGWVVNQTSNEPIDHYEVLIKGSDGTDIYAVLGSSGELISYKTINKNAAVPANILNAIAKTEYKDWNVERGTEVIKDEQKKVVEHFIVRLDNGKHSKTLYYTMEGNQLINN